MQGESSACPGISFPSGFNYQGRVKNPSRSLACFPGVDLMHQWVIFFSFLQMQCTSSVCDETWVFSWYARRIKMQISWSYIFINQSVLKEPAVVGSLMQGSARLVQWETSGWWQVLESQPAASGCKTWFPCWYKEKTKKQGRQGDLTKDTNRKKSVFSQQWHIGEYNFILLLQPR